MKFNLMILIVLCLLQALNSFPIKIKEQSLKVAAVKTLKYARSFLHESIILKDKINLYDLKFNCSPLNINNIRFNYDLIGLYLHIKIIGLEATLEGKYNYKLPFRRGVTPFIAKLSISWDQEFSVYTKDLGNGKLDIKYKYSDEPIFHLGMTLYNDQNIEMSYEKTKTPILITENLKYELNRVDFSELTNQFDKVAKLILETLQADLK